MGTLDKLVGRGVLALAFIAFVLSFEKLHHVALTSGINPWLSWLYPLIVEGFTTIATLAAFLKRGQRGAGYPWAVGVLAFTFSLWANAAPDSVPGGIVRAVPVMCIPLAVHMFIIIRAVVELHPKDVTEEAPEAILISSDDTVLVEVPTGVSKAAANFLDMAKTATDPTVRAFWERKAAEAVA